MGIKTLAKRMAGGVFVFVSLAIGLLIGAAPCAAQGVPPGWVGYHHAGQLLVLHPPGWQVQERGGGAFIAFLPGSGPAALALLYVKPQRFSAQRNVADALGLLGSEEATLFPTVAVRRATVLPPGQLPAGLQGVVGELGFTVGGEPYTGSALVWGDGASGSLVVISAAQAAWDRHRGTMLQILQNYRYLSAAPAQPAQTAPGAALDMVLWRDPAEGAFTLPVPRGWQVSGGLKRPNPFVYKPDIVVTSPDGAIQLRLGDASIPNFAEPYMVPGMGMMSEGTQANGGMVLMNYRPGHAFLTQLYLPSKFGAVPQVQTQDLPALAAQAFQLRPPAPPIQARTDAGAVRFTLPSPAGPRTAWFVVVTRRDVAPGVGAAWYVDLVDLAGLICPPAQEGQARAILAELVGGFRWDRRWNESQARANAALGRAVVDHNEAMNAMLARHLAGQAAGREAAQEPLTRLPLGQIVVRDEQSGQEIRVQSTGSQDYYRVHRTGEVIGSDRPDLPPFEYRVLTQVR